MGGLNADTVRLAFEVLGTPAEERVEIFEAVVAYVAGVNEGHRLKEKENPRG